VTTLPDLVSNATKKLQRRPPPTLNDILTGGPQSPPLTDESRAGLSVQAQLASQHSDELEALDAQQCRAAEARKAADDALWARISARRDRVVRI
jgi:hypothetical protein